jgi:ubiquitin-conjugating enzyme E2 O
MWIPGKSTMLQVLVSIQALILNAKPFFNEPGYESSYVGAEGDKRSKKYNEEVFILSLKTMMYTLRRPPKV